MFVSAPTAAGVPASSVATQATARKVRLHSNRVFDGFMAPPRVSCPTRTDRNGLDEGPTRKVGGPRSEHWVRVGDGLTVTRGSSGNASRRVPAASGTGAN